MNVSLNWLKERLDFGSRSLEEVCDLLTFAGIEIEGLHEMGVKSDQIVVAEIKEAVQHPDADRLKVTQVDAGEGSLRQIVCGATNYKVGDKVPCCLPGAALPGGFKIGETKMRGVESKGMLAAGSEIGLTDKEDGLLILDPDFKIGTPVKDLFDSDTLIEVEITPNRPDLLSHSGLARELAALLHTETKPVEKSHETEIAEDSAVVTVDSATCPFYSVLSIRGVKVAPSPDWLAKKLKAIGLRPINNIVDITNYVLHEIGQPLHAFDAGKVDGAIHVRQASEGEAFKALDEETYDLKDVDCIISDQSGTPLALAGVMGGLDSGVTDSTTDILLESAYFTTSEIRRTSRRLFLTSDSSYRFERGVDPQQVLPASALAAALILEVAGGEVVGKTVTAGQLPGALPTVELNVDRMLQLMDNSISLEDAGAILTRLGLSSSDLKTWEIPSWRGDLERSADLVEEIARTHGLENVPSRTGGTAVDESKIDHDYDRLLDLKKSLVALGFYETQTIKLIAENQLRDCLPLRPLQEGDLVKVARPLSEDHAILRPALTPGLLATAENNLRQGAKTLRFFEAGRQFRNVGGGKATDLEADSIALLLAGEASPLSWTRGENRLLDLYDLKAAIQAVLGNRSIQFTTRARDGFLLAGDIQLGGKPIGTFAQVMPSRAREIGFRAPIYLAELDQKKILGIKQDMFQVEPLPQFPGSSRDIAMELPIKTSNAEIEKVLSKHSDPLLVSAICFDQFHDPSGEKMPADKRSIAYSFGYRSEKGTMKQKEIDTAHDKLRAHLQKSLPVTFR
ncbi:phenylalanine--tRNA ligase subunit beta [bacterium]|jgi:phenylalanyl-tRNA synthetase beta chain|nr:phenylalanine--tRNA ligase subunit beta [bacterium]MDB4488488.1 phenylalanine--tRNA ligase subunit beta [Akkermansiaceae bacterium]MDB4566983.1 phenylalanine--tRNA ligase subunit beta [Akkermansiaceae bacterium]